MDDSNTVVMDEVMMWMFTNRVRIDQVIQLEDVASKSDPEDNIYKSLYEAREVTAVLLTELRAKLTEIPVGTLLHVKGLAVLSSLAVRQGVNYMETEERPEGEELLLRVVSECESTPGLAGLTSRLTETWVEDASSTTLDTQATLDSGKLVCGVLRHAYTALGTLYSDRNQVDEALTYLRRAKRLYREWRALTSEAWPETGYSLLGHESNKKDCFEAGYTITLFNLAQVCAKLSDLKSKVKSAKYCHRTLLRQLDSMNYQPLEWALNCATISQYYVTAARFQIANHCLCASERILSEEVKNEDNEDKIVQARADIIRCWIKYGLRLLEVSWERMGDDDILTQAGKDKQMSLEPEFDRFNIDLCGAEDRVRWHWTTNYEEARTVFLAIQDWIKEAKVFYAIDRQCSDYIQLIQDQSKAFRHIANFDPSLERQCRMHKRRVDMMQELLKELNKQHYVMACRQLSFEIAQTLSDMLDLKLALLEMSSGDSTASQSDRVHAGRKIHHLAQESLHSYQQFLNYHQRPDGSMPEKFPSDEVRSVLVAHFCMGRLYKKLLDRDPRMQMKNLQLATDEFQFLVDYTTQNPEVEPLVVDEVAVCREMIQLMPVSMAEIQAKIA